MYALIASLEMLSQVLQHDLQYVLRPHQYHLGPLTMGGLKQMPDNSLETHFVWCSAKKVEITPLFVLSCGHITEHMILR